MASRAPAGQDLPDPNQADTVVLHTSFSKIKHEVKINFTSHTTLNVKMFMDSRLIPRLW